MNTFRMVHLKCPSKPLIIPRHSEHHCNIFSVRAAMNKLGNRTRLDKYLIHFGWSRQNSEAMEMCHGEGTSTT